MVQCVRYAAPQGDGGIVRQMQLSSGFPVGVEGVGQIFVFKFKFQASPWNLTISPL